MTDSVSERARQVVRHLLMSVGILAVAGSAAAQTSDADRANARELGREALAAFTAHDFPRAEERAERALQLHKAPTLYLVRARARIALGKVVSGCEDLRAVSRFVPSADEPPAFVQARTEAQAELTRVEPQVPHLTLAVDETVARVEVNGVEWPAAAYGVARPIDPGAYRLEVTDRAGSVETLSIELRLGQSETMRLHGPAALQPSAAVAQPGSPAQTPRAVLDASQSDARSPRVPDRTAAYVVGAVTLALTAGAIAAGIVALDRRSEFNDLNRNDDVAISEKEKLHSSAATWSWVNTALVAGAIAGAGVTAYLFLVPSESTATSGLQLVATGRF